MLYGLVERNLERFLSEARSREAAVPGFVEQEFRRYLKCGRLEHGFLRVRCDDCKHERLLAFSCKGRGWCPSCGANRMAETAAWLVDELLPRVPYRQWVLTFPYPLRFLLASSPELQQVVLTVVHRALSAFIVRRCGLRVQDGARTGAVTVLQRFGSALNRLNLHLHIVALDGAYRMDDAGEAEFVAMAAPRPRELAGLLTRLSQRLLRALVKAGALEVDEDTGPQLRGGAVEGFDALLGASITYRVAFGPRRGAKAAVLKQRPAADDGAVGSDLLARQSGFSLHGGVSVASGQRWKL